MELFLDILTRVTLPIIIVIALGWLLQPKLKLDVGSLNRVQVYVVMPAFLLHFLSSAKQPIAVVWPAAIFGVALFAMLIPIGWLTAIMFRQRVSLGPVMGLSTAYANVGFFGIPVTQLAFGPDHLIYMSVMTALTTIMLCTAGVWILAPSRGGILSKLKTAFETPLIPAVGLGLLLKGFELEIPTVLGQPLQFIGSIFTPLALYTLGAQISSTKKFKVEILPQTLILLLKFLLAPALSWITIFAVEYDTEPEFVSTAVVISTLLSPFFVTAWILAVKLFLV